MAEQVLHKLSTQFNIHLQNVQQLRNGHNLIIIAFKLLYHQHNDFLASKLSAINLTNQSFSKSQLNESLMSNQSATTKPGNNVILINTLLKHIKSDKSLLLPNSIKQLTFYNILEEDQLLCRFIEWMMMQSKKQTKNQSNECESAQFQSHSYQNLDQAKQNFQSTSSNQFKKIQIHSTKAKQNYRFKTQERQKNSKNFDKQENELENLYFASNLKQKLNDSPIDSRPQNTDKIVRKGSFKLLKPKVIFSEQSNSDQQPKQLQESNRIHKKTFEIYEPDELKEISMIESSQPHISSNLANIQPNFDNQMSQLNDSIDEIVNKKIVDATPSVSLEKQNHRKTVPKNLSKPPLYRSSIKNKQNLHNESKTIEQKSKKKNFFNFQNQSQQLVSGFNDETIKNSEQMKVHQKKIQLSEKKLSQIQKNERENLKNREKSVLKFYEMDGSNVIEEDEGYIMQENTQIEEGRIRPNRVESNFTSSSSLLKLKNHFLQKQLYTLDKQIQNQKPENRKQEPNLDQDKQAHSLYNSQPKNESFSFTKRGSRKVSKIHIKQTEDTVKQDIVDWLTSIRIISGTSINLHQVFQIFRNGVKFVQLCNHYIGRSRAIPYFNNPKKNAQIHSNFSKVFQHLKSFSNFPQKELLFAYQLFISNPQQGSIWNLLEAIYTILHMKCIKQSKSKGGNESQFFQQQSRIRSSSKGKQEYSQENGRTNLSNKHIKFNTNKGSQSFINKQFKNTSVVSSRKHSTFSKPIQFVPFAPELSRHYDLVQQSQQPDENQAKNILNINQNGVNNNVLTEGYKQKYLRRAIDTSNSKDHHKSQKQFFSLQTPKKQIIQNKQQSSIGHNKSKILDKSLINRSSSKKVLQSQIKKLQTSSHQINSIIKNSSKKPFSKLSKVTLNMQMKVQRFINQQNLATFLNNSYENNEFKRVQMLEDPIRNGTLINILFERLQSQDIKYIKVPQSIEDCRLNYNKVFNMIKNKYGQQIFESFELFTELVEQILKGERNIFYGVAYQMIQVGGNRKVEDCNQKVMVESSSQDSYDGSKQQCMVRTEMSKSQMIRLYCYNPIQWVRVLQMRNPLTSALKIRSLDDLYTHVSTSIFLFSLLPNTAINMVYLNPQSVNERQANLKKVMIYMVQMRILNREDLMNSHQIALKNYLVIGDLLQKLVYYTVTKEWSYIERNINSLRKILLKQSAIKKTQQTNINPTYHGPFNPPFNQTETNSHLNHNYQNYPQTHSLSSTNNIKNLNLQSQGKILPQMHKAKDKDKNQNKKHMDQFEVEIPWMRKLGFTNCSLNLNNGILLCRLISKLTRTNIKYNQNISHDAQIPKPQALAYIRKALKLIPGCRIDEIEIFEADERKTLQIYLMIRDKFRTNYQMGKVGNMR